MMQDRDIAPRKCQGKRESSRKLPIDPRRGKKAAYIKKKEWKTETGGEVSISPRDDGYFAY